MTLKYKVVSYLTSSDSQPYVHGYYGTIDEAEKVKDDYNAMWSHGKLYAKVEEVI
jgi:hypothetical protein